MKETIMQTPETKRRSVLRLRDFRLLWLGEGISLLGDQFYIIALPWLVLQLTGSGLAVGGVLAVAGIPRAIFMLIGGALTDRFSPRLMMLASNLGRMLLVSLLALLILTGLIELWMVYAFALLFGLADAFFFPASASIIPQIVEKDDLPAANAIIGGTAQLSLFVGPLVAGLMIALLANGQAVDGETVPDLQGIGLAFAFDALTFVVSILTLWLMRTKPHPAQAEATKANMLASIREGLVNVWQDRTLRALFIVASAINLLFIGPIEVGIPYLADTRLPEGAAAFGIIMALFGGGMLVGTILAGTLPKPKPERLGTLLVSLISTLGIGLIPLGFVNTTALAAVIVLLMSVANGYVNIFFITWLQARTPPAILGRTMSLIMFASVGMQPISTALAGVLVEINVTALFVVTGTILILVTLISAFNPALRAMGLEPVTESAPA
jgi:MFS family permease